MIVSFADEAAETFFRTGKCSKAGWQGVAKVAARKLDYLNAAKMLEDLARPPANRLEGLYGDREG